AWIMDTYSMKVGFACPEVVTGKPVELGGCVGRREATGRGVTYCILEALKELRLDPRQCTAAVQGFGNVGSVACQELAAHGVKIVAVSDRYGGIHNPRGLDVPALFRHASSGFVRDFPGGGEPMSNAALLTGPCTIVVPAAIERVITEVNAPKLRCRVLAEGANGPTTPEADEVLADSDIFIIPDVMCNAGGVTVSYFEWVQDIQQLMWSEQQVNQKLQELILRAFHQMLQGARKHNVNHRTPALSRGVEKAATEKTGPGPSPKDRP